MKKKTLRIRNLLSIANEKKRTARLFDEFGMWRFARDDKRHYQTIQKMIRRMRK